jgi:hypothetical protein
LVSLVAVGGEHEVPRVDELARMMVFRHQRRQDSAVDHHREQ